MIVLLCQLGPFTVSSPTDSFKIPLTESLSLQVTRVLMLIHSVKRSPSLVSEHIWLPRRGRKMLAVNLQVLLTKADAAFVSLRAQTSVMLAVRTGLRFTFATLTNVAVSSVSSKRNVK